MDVGVAGGQPGGGPEGGDRILPTFDPKLAERFQDMFATMAGLGSTRSSDKKK